MSDIPQGYASFSGFDCQDGEITISKGVTPAIGLIRVEASDRPITGIGPLRFGYGTETVEFEDCLPLPPSLRKVKGGSTWMWSYPIADHRWRWLTGSITGEYNLRISNGHVDSASRREPAQLATLLLDAMGETNYDVSRMPMGIYPQVKWEATNPARALDRLCDATACVVTGGEFGRVVIWPVGQGTIPEIPGGSPAHPEFRYPVVRKPKTLVVEGGPIWYQSRLSLQPIALKTTGDQSTLADAPYKPTGGWEQQSPFTLAGVASGSQFAALESVWRQFRVSGQSTGGLAVPGCDEEITSVNQYLLNDFLIDAGLDLDDVSRALESYVSGTYWPYSDDAVNVTQFYIGLWKLLAERNIVEFSQPVFSLDSQLQPTDPTLALNTSYGVRKADGTVVRYRRERDIGGPAGTYVIRRPDLFATVKETVPGPGTTDTFADADIEAEAILDAFQAKFSRDEASEQQYAGIIRAPLDGIVAQVKYQAGVNQVPKTRIGLVEEFDVHTNSSANRQRMQAIATLQESQ